jgi:hypothetical protein
MHGELGNPDGGVNCKVQLADRLTISPRNALNSGAFTSGIIYATHQWKWHLCLKVTPATFPERLAMPLGRPPTYERADGGRQLQ